MIHETGGYLIPGFSYNVLIIQIYANILHKKYQHIEAFLGIHNYGMGKLEHVLKCKCPNCKNGDIFQHHHAGLPFRIPKMYPRCPICGYKFEKETGFFFGAMFVSYALTAAQMIVCLFLFWYLIGLSPLSVFFIIAFMAAILSSLNFRLSRSIWIYLFYKV